MSDKDHPTTEYDDYGSENNYDTGYDDGIESDGYTSEDYEPGEYESDDNKTGDYASDDYDAEYSDSDSYASDDYDAEDGDPEYYDSEQYAASDYDDAYDQGEYDVESADPATIDPDTIPPEALEPYYDKSAFKWLKNMNRAKLIRLVSMLIFSVAILVFASIAWFTMNKGVGTSGMGVKVAGSPFELAVPDTANIGAKSFVQTGTGESAIDDSGTSLHDLPGGLAVADGVSDNYSYITDLNNGTTSTGDFYTTGGSYDTIKWRLNSIYDKTNDGLGPASYGDFLFYVVPKRSGALNIKVKIELEGYSADVKKNETGSYDVDDLTLISSGSSSYSSVEYLNTHLLFFTGRTGEGTEASPYYYTGLIDKDELNLSFSNCEIDKLIPVHIYWIWPNTFAEFTCLAANGNVANPSGNDLAIQTVNALRQYVIDNRAVFLKMNANTALSYMADTNVVDEEEVYSFNVTKAENKLRELSIGYNDADQSIGTTVKYFLLTLTAE